MNVCRTSNSVAKDFPLTQVCFLFVQTIGDCYVACTGLPEPRAEHATAMCQFALDCLERMRVLVKKLEVLLGPDTGTSIRNSQSLQTSLLYKSHHENFAADLAMRIGIHSGPVTAGVLRGDRSRFQL